MVGSKTNRVVLYVSASLVVILILFAMLRDNAEPITLANATKILENKSVKSVISSQDYIYLKTDKEIYKIASSQVSPKMFTNYEVSIKNSSNIVIYFLFLVLFLGFAALLYRWFQKNEYFNVAKADSGSYGSKQEGSRPIESIKSDVTFDDIGGISDVKSELEEIIDFMKKPKRYKSFGARMPRGVLLVGPPGVGKTMIAKAVANAAGVPFYYQSGASFVQIYVGMGAKRVHELFAAAKNSAPAIIFIDEIDAVGKKRDGQRSDEREATLNQLLTEMDGFENSSGIIVIAATNKIDVLDSALLRAGRFDRRIFVELPTNKERALILSKYLQKVPNEVDVKTIANMTVGFNGASLAALVNEASLLAIRQHDFQVTIDHFDHVKDKVMFGKKKLQILSEMQKRFRVTYQAAKVVCATYYDLPFEKILLSNEKLTPSTDEPLIKHELESRVKMLLAGIVACNIKYNEHASSAKADLDEAKEIILKMIEEYGMGSTLIAKESEKEILINRLYNETKSLLESLQSVIKRVEDVLNERENISKLEVKKYINEVL
ncbi:Peptidase M41 [Sulfurimonas denitrificans DSM 1251]|uniref:Peptidase M41 n=1 Tax=Sulfurimonas denitrificans (strain ATCC 33889 / DSM 1251) TaxID=326298 RepID=Q30RT0_SULDN|nr:AAA family ATPase [Sulfurimonas denitrificans]ABB44301.1 Peptidase M41 [Sulfurimonas denitrificans DSM 1251]